MTLAVIAISAFALLFLGTTLYLGKCMLRVQRELDAYYAERFDRAVARHLELHKAEIERLQNVKTVGVATIPEAKVIHQEVEPEARINRELSEEMIAKGAQAIMEEYQRINVPITEAEARAQAEFALLQGSFPT